jgi:hypothetical protein
VASDGAAEQGDEADGRRGALPRDGTDGARSLSPGWSQVNDATLGNDPGASSRGGRDEASRAGHPWRFSRDERGGRPNGECSR